MRNFFVVSLGGSIVSLESGLNVNFLKKFRKLIISRIEKGDKFIIVVGGGYLARKSISDSRQVFKDVESNNRDWIGISATHVNANIVKAIFSDLAYNVLADNPYKKIKTNKSLIFSGGYLPGNSSDLVAVILAKTYGAREIINMSNINYVYDSDPKKNKNAKKIEKITWKDFLKIIGNKWTPGLNTPFDPIASKMCKSENKKVVVLNGLDLKNLNNHFSGKKFKGTKIYG